MHGLCSIPTASILSRCHFSRSFARQLKIRFAGSSDNIGAMQLQLEGVSEVDLGAARFSLPRAAAMESGPSSVASIAFNGRAFCKEGGRTRTRAWRGYFAREKCRLGRENSGFGSFAGIYSQMELNSNTNHVCFCCFSSTRCKLRAASFDVRLVILPSKIWGSNFLRFKHMLFVG